MCNTAAAAAFERCLLTYVWDETSATKQSCPVLQTGEQQV